MFSKKVFPKGTFISTPLRVIVILHLSLAFTYLSWASFIPFLGEHFQKNRYIELYQTIHSSKEFSSLEDIEKITLDQDFQKIQALQQRSFKEKTQEAIYILAFKLKPFLQAWIALSIITAILILLKIEGAKEASSVLVILSFLSLIWYQPKPLTYEEKLFPTEQKLVENYLKKELDGSINQQKEALKQGWELYLVDQWAKNRLNQKKEYSFEEKLLKGEFFFSIARLNALKKDFYTQPLFYTPLWIALFFNFLWTIFFALFVNFYKK